MPTVELAIHFKAAVSANVTKKNISRKFTRSNLTLNFNFNVGLSTNTKRMIMRREFFPGGIPLSISFKTALSEQVVFKQIRREFELSNAILTTNFKVGIPPNTQTHELWRFVKWTLGGPCSENYYIIRTVEKPFLTIEPLPILPRLRGQTYPVNKRPDYHTLVKQSPSSVDKTYETWQFPRWYIELTYEFLEGNAQGSDYRQLLDFFVARHGSLEDFWYKDPDDNQTENERIGIGDGMTRSFQLCRTYCGRTEPIFSIDTAFDFEISIDGEKQSISKFSVTSSGVVTFKTEPPPGAEIRASFHYFYRCRFTEDESEFENFAHKLWSLKSLSMVTTL